MFPVAVESSMAESAGVNQVSYWEQERNHSEGKGVFSIWYGGGKGRSIHEARIEPIFTVSYSLAGAIEGYAFIV